MTLRRFIDVSFVILVEMFQQYNMTLLDAIDRVEAWANPEEDVPSKAEKIDNRQSMDQMLAMMAGVKGAPV